jgi:hypothetical protein
MTVVGLVSRLTSTGANVIPNISVGRWTNITNSWGGYATNQTLPPDWGLMLWNVINVYPDAIGPIAWLVLFSMPFIMMWVAHADMYPAAIIGVFFGIYVFARIPDQYSYVGVAILCVAATGIIIETWRR